jgi:hypothetical protein
MKRVALLAMLAAALGAQQKTADDPWAGLRFLIGSWEARTDGGAAGAASAGVYSFQLNLREHVLMRTSRSAGCQGPASFDCEHRDLLIVYRDAPSQPLKAIYFDNEDHTIHYELSFPESNTAVFLSPAATPGPRYRLIYELRNHVMKGRFQIRMPGQGEFRSYLEWSGGAK